MVGTQVSVEELPLVTDVGLAVRVTDGFRDDTFTVADEVAVPPLTPVQEMPKVVEVVNAPVFQEVVVVAKELPFQKTFPPVAVQDAA